MINGTGSRVYTAVSPRCGTARIERPSPGLERLRSQRHFLLGDRVSMKSPCSCKRWSTGLVFAWILAACGNTTLCGQSDATQHSPDRQSGAVSSNSASTDARRLLREGKARDAVAAVSALVEANPSDPEANKLLGQAYFRLQDFVKAEDAFAKVMKTAPDDLESVQMRGLSLYQLGRPSEAIPFLLRVKEMGGHVRVDPYYLLALCYMDTERFDEARGALASKFAFPPDSARAYLLTARLLLRRNLTNQARRFASRALEIDPRLLHAHQLLGETYLSEDKLEEAIVYFKRELEIDPLDPSPYDRLGDAYQRAGNNVEAEACLKKAVLLGPSTTGPYMLLGKVLLREHDPDNAVLYLEHAESMDPNSQMTHWMLMQAYRSLGRVGDLEREVELLKKSRGDKDANDMQQDNRPRTDKGATH